MHTTIDCKSYLIKQLASRAIPWETSEKEWDKTSQYREGENTIREFQHKVEGLILSVRESEHGLTLDFDRSSEYLKSMRDRNVLGIEPSDFFITVADSGANRFGLYAIAKTYFHQQNKMDDNGESLDLCAQTFFALFPDLNVRRLSQSFEVSGAPASEVWRRLLAVGFVENSLLKQHVGKNALESLDCKQEQYNSMSVLDARLDALGNNQKLTAPPPSPPKKTLIPQVIPTQPVVSPSGNVSVTPPQRNGAGSGARHVAPPPLRKFGEIAAAVKHSSMQEDMTPSTLDISFFQGENWPPARKEDYPKAIESLLAKRVLSAGDLKKLADGFSKLENSTFLQISTIATTLQHPNNPGLLSVVAMDKERRLTLGEIVEYPQIDTTSYDLGFL